MLPPGEDEPLSFDDDGEDDEAPAPLGKLYITRQGAERLRQELKHLLHTERPKVTSEVTAAAAQGDRSENAEYIYGKKRLREIDRRLRFLQKRLEAVTVVDPGEQKEKGKVFFGATVTLENEEDGSKSTYQIVGPDETDTKLGRISVESPIGRALIGKQKGDTVTVMRPRGEAELTVLAIKYA
ncbi:MAG: transcription elongation factor GreB [Myxococcaceae bacterium]|nr:transcription elongation factor GreB [Myxococcaceae bacterium]